MFTDITNDNKKIYEITKSGEHIFYFENKSDDITFNIMCEKANVKIYGLYQCKNSDEFTLKITQKHFTPNSASNVLIKSILKDRSKFNFTGIIQIPKNAQNTTAHLTNKNLLLSTKAHVTTLPQLEIMSDQVDCKHSAKIIPLDTSQLNYIISRGISKKSAKKLLIQGFIAKIKK